MRQSLRVNGVSGELRVHPHTSPEVSGRFVRSSAFTRQKVVNAPSRLKAELQTGAMRGCTRELIRPKCPVDFACAFDKFHVPLLSFKMKTYLPKVNLDQRKWHVIDADGAVLGRLAVQVADILRGKNKPVYTPHLDAGDFVVVINAEKVRVTGKKETAKEYMSYSGWKGGEKYRTVAQMRAKNPEKLILHAVKGMIPKNRLGSQLLTKLKVFKGAKHPHAAQKPEPLKAAA
jgi:large subunit ribosomal protein L13